MNHNQKIGAFGENLAKNFLLTKGYKILETNLKLKYQELDIIAKIDNVTVFVEVKTRIYQNWGGADEAMDSLKIANMITAAHAYINLNKIDENLVRLDFIAVNIFRNEGRAKITHYKGII